MNRNVGADVLSPPVLRRITQIRKETKNVRDNS